MATKKFPSELAARSPVLPTDILLIHNITSGATEKSTVAALLAAGTKYWNCPGIHFDAREPDVGNIYKDLSGYLLMQSDGIAVVCPVLLPGGAVVSSAIVMGNAGAEDEYWYLRRITIADRTLLTMAQATFNTADTSISSATIDNSLYAYFFCTDTMITSDEIWGARITYI